MQGERGGNSTTSRCKRDGGAATTNQHERGAAQGETRWRDKRGKGWYGKGLHGQHDKRQRSTTARILKEKLLENPH